MQLKNLAGMMQQMLDKALKDRGQVEAIGGSRGESSGQAGTNREMPGESETGGPQALRVGQWDDRGTQGLAGLGAGGQGQGSGPRVQPASQVAQRRRGAAGPGSIRVHATGR